MAGGHSDQNPKRMKHYFADTFAMLVFSLLIGAFVELAITGLTLDQTIRIRVAAVPISLLIGRPYGLYRNWIFKKLHGGYRSSINKFLMDTFVNLTFQIPLYALILALNGATGAQIFTAVSSILLIAGLSGRPYGLFLTMCRRWFGVSAD